MRKLQEYRSSIWRVPLIAVIAGFLYIPLYVRIVVHFGVIEPGVIDPLVSLLTSAGLLFATLVLGGVTLLRKQSRKEILISAAVVSLYGIVLMVLQLITNSVAGPAAVIFLHMQTPLEWTGFFSEVFLFLENSFGISCPAIGWLRPLVPFCFVLFGRKTIA